MFLASCKFVHKWAQVPRALKKGRYGHSKAEINAWRAKIITAAGRKEDMAKLQDKNLCLCKSHFSPSAWDPEHPGRLRFDALPMSRFELAWNSPPTARHPKERAFAAAMQDVDASCARKASAAIVTAALAEKDTQIQTLQEEVARLRAAVAAGLHQQPADQEVEFQLDKSTSLRYNDFFANPRHKRPDVVRALTNFPSFDCLDTFFYVLNVKNVAVNLKLYGSGADDSTVVKPSRRKLTAKDCYFLTLYRLRTGATAHETALRFGISKATTCRIFASWIVLLDEVLDLITPFPSKAEIQQTLPSKFKISHDAANVRVIVDAFELNMEHPSDPELAKTFYSAYKSNYTAKVLIGQAPNGIVTFVSDAFPGSISDDEIVRQSGLLELLEVGDFVMADKGFHGSRATLLEHGCDILEPPKRFMGQTRLTSDEERDTARIANLRIHIERTIGFVKMWNILQKPIQLQGAALMCRIIKVLARINNWIHNPTVGRDYDAY